MLVCSSAMSNVQLKILFFGEIASDHRPMVAGFVPRKNANKPQ